MKIIIYLILTMSFLYSSDEKEILLLHSYNNGLKWSDTITLGVKKSLEKYPEYEITVESMDSKKIDTKEYLDILLDLYEKKFSKRKYSVIITADNYAYNFAVKNQKKIFNNTPIVFCGVENFNEKDIPLENRPLITGIVEYKEIKKNIDMISQTIINLDTLYIISDNSFSSLMIEDQILNVIKKYEKNINIIFDNKININTIEKKIAELPANSAVLFTSLYKDIQEEYIPYNKLRTIFHSSPYPIFAVNTIHLGEGVVGGLMVDPFVQGELAGERASAIINGVNPSSIKIYTPSSKYYFDYNILKKFGLTNFKIPDSSTIINKPETFFERNRSFVDSAFLLMPFFILLIIGLIVNIVRRVKLEIKLIEQSKLDGVLLNNIKGAVYWKSKDNKILGCNDSLCRMLELPKEKIIGYEMSFVMPEVYEKIDNSNGFIEEIELSLHFKHRKMDALIRRRKYFNKKNEEAGVVTIISDITQIKALENQRKKEEQFVIQRSKLSEIGEMMTSVAHQWKTPLIEISTIAQELLYKRSKKEFTKADSQEFVDEIMKQVQYMTKTIDDFRSFIKPSLKKSEFEIDLAMNELLRVIEHNIKYNYIKIDVKYENDTKFKIYGYPNEFKQAILSIINNARDSILKKRKSEEFEGQITVDVSSKKNKIFISIKDNGLGIKEEHLEKIFESFFTTKENGDGFGLYMVKLIIEDKMNGEIKAVKCENGANIMICIENKVSI